MSNGFTSGKRQVAPAELNTLQPLSDDPKDKGFYVLPRYDDFLKHWRDEDRSEPNRPNGNSSSK